MATAHAVRPPLGRSRRSLTMLSLLSAVHLCVACAGGEGGVTTPDPDLPGVRNGSLSGTVRSEATGEPLANAIVTVGALERRTGADGRFAFADLPAGSVILRCAAAGFGPVQATVSIATAATTFDVAMRPQQVFEFQGGAVALQVPSTVDTVRAILLVAGGPDGRAFANPQRSFDVGATAPPDVEAGLDALRTDYQVIAQQRGVAILGLERGRATDNLEQVLDEAARATARPELRTVPVLAHGMSLGTFAAVTLAARLPSRVAGIVLRAPIEGAMQAVAEGSVQVPTLLITAERDDVVDNRVTDAAFRTVRGSGGLWAIAEEPGAVHIQLSDETRQLIVAWFGALLDLRLPVTSGGPLRALAEDAGWLGDLGAREIATWSAYAGDRRAASWLPTQPVAERWRALVR